MGPQLGPLVVTGVSARVTRAGLAYLRSLDLASLPRIDDSKKVAAFGNTGLAEAWARVFCADATTPAEMVDTLSHWSRDELRAPCPRGVDAQCWGDAGVFAAPPDLVEAVRGDRDRLATMGVELLTARTLVVCPERLHRERAAGRSLLDTDLHAMEDLLLWFRAGAGVDLEATCGKIGGLGRYVDRLGPLRGRAVEVEEEGRASSRYRIEGLGRVAFVRDADGSDLLVALASLVGKYMREVAMGRVVEFYRARVPGLHRASGYRDPVTDRFVLATLQARRDAGVPDRCFLRP